MATMQEVADRAGVSIATVSFVVNGTKRVLPATRQRVEEAMHDLGYTRNHAGAALARGRTDIIALLYPALDRNLSGTAMEFFTSAAERARQRGFKLVLWPGSNTAAEIAELTATGIVDGVLLMEVQWVDERVDVLQRGNTPFALIGRPQDPQGMAWVDVDFASSVRSAVTQLVSLGHTSIAYASGQGERRFTHAGGARALEAYRQAVAGLGLDEITFEFAETPRAGRELAARLREEHPEATALIVMNEHAAPGVVIGLAQLGVSIPDDLSVISVGTSANMAAMAEPSLTYMASPGAQLGRLGVDAIIDRITDPAQPLPQILIPCIPGEGESVGRAPSS